jgi:hypothetical protein
VGPIPGEREDGAGEKMIAKEDKWLCEGLTRRPGEEIGKCIYYDGVWHMSKVLKYATIC